MRAGRARWKIENETFDTLKSQGYQFKHNFGHGEQNLSVVVAMLMMLAFLTDQIQQLKSDLFGWAWQSRGSKGRLWESLRAIFRDFEVTSMRQVLEAIAYGIERAPPPIKFPY